MLFIQTANTFLGEDGSVKIGDMNVSKRLKRGQLQTQIGTPVCCLCILFATLCNC